MVRAGSVSIRRATYFERGCRMMSEGRSYISSMIWLMIAYLSLLVWGCTIDHRMNVFYFFNNVVDCSIGGKQPRPSYTTTSESELVR